MPFSRIVAILLTGSSAVDSGSSRRKSQAFKLYALDWSRKKLAVLDPSRKSENEHSAGSSKKAAREMSICVIQFSEKVV